MKAVIGMTAGAVGAFVGTPAEISLIRMTSDGRYVNLFYQYSLYEHQNITYVINLN